MLLAPLAVAQEPVVGAVSGASSDASRLLLGGDPDPKSENVCPFLYDAYQVQVGSTTWSFEPWRLGFTHGFYCSLKWGEGPLAVDFRFNNSKHEACQCPTARYCQTDWGVIDKSELGVVGSLIGDVQVGRCAVYDWVLLAPLVVAFFTALCCGCIAARHRRFKRNNVVVIRNEPTEYVSLD